MKKSEVSSVSNNFALTVRKLRKEILLNESFASYPNYMEDTLEDLIFQCKARLVLASGKPCSFSPDDLRNLDSIYLELISRKAPFALKIKREQFSSWLVANKNSIQELQEFFDVK
jgi:hypothetical protein